MTATAGRRIGPELCYRDQEFAVRYAMAQRKKKLTDEELRILACDPDPMVRAAIARRSQWLPLDVATDLAGDNDAYVKKMMKRREDYPGAKRRAAEKAMREREARAAEQGYKYGYIYPENSRIAARARNMHEVEAMEKLNGLIAKGGKWPSWEMAYGFAEHPDPEVRALAARMDETATPILKKLMRDENYSVRANSVLNPNFDRRDLRKMSKDKLATVRAAVADRAEDQLLIDMADAPSPIVREAVARNVRARTEANVELVRDTSPRVRGAAAQMMMRSSSDEAVASRLGPILEQGDPVILRAAAANEDWPSKSDESLHQLAVAKPDRVTDRGTKIPAQEEIARRVRAKRAKDQSDPAQKTRQVRGLNERQAYNRENWPERVSVILMDTNLQTCSHKGRDGVVGWTMSQDLFPDGGEPRSAREFDAWTKGFHLYVTGKDMPSGIPGKWANSYDILDNSLTDVVMPKSGTKRPRQEQKWSTP